jgi:hypothetical protein
MQENKHKVGSYCRKRLAKEECAPNQRLLNFNYFRLDNWIDFKLRLAVSLIQSNYIVERERGEALGDATPRHTTQGEDWPIDRPLPRILDETSTADHYRCLHSRISFSIQTNKREQRQQFLLPFRLNGAAPANQFHCCHNMTNLGEKSNLLREKWPVWRLF